MHLDSELCHKPLDHQWLGEWCSACWGWKRKEQLNSSLHLSTSPFFSLVAVPSASINPSLLLPLPTPGGFPHSSAGSKESACNVGGLSSVPGLERSPKDGKGYPLHYSMDCIVCGVEKSWTQLSDFHFHQHQVRLAIGSSLFPPMDTDMHRHTHHCWFLTCYFFLPVLYIHLFDLNCKSYTVVYS